MNEKVRPWGISIIGGIISGFIVLYLWDFWRAKEMKLQIITFLVDWLPISVGVLVFLIILFIMFLIKHYKPSRTLTNMKESIRIIRNHEGWQYLIQGETSRHIPDEPTFYYLKSFFGFTCTTNTSELMSSENIEKTFRAGSMLPSITTYCPKGYLH